MFDRLVQKQCNVPTRKLHETLPTLSAAACRLFQVCCVFIDVGLSIFSLEKLHVLPVVVRLLLKQNLVFRFCGILLVSRVAEQLQASLEELCSMILVG
jgi:hypothetical protein